ncbi:MAG: VanZ family protein [Limnobacter sp.]|nr:VanZ family protein [Limnobacter sp.]
MKPLLRQMPPIRPLTGLLVLAVLYAVMITHLSLYPYEHFRNIGVGPFDYLYAPWVPVWQKVLWDDIAFNILAYLPLGFLLFPSLGKWPLHAERLLAPLLCIGMSFGLEALQTYLPSRVPSKMDVLTNAIGAVLGCGLAFLVQSRSAWPNRLGQQLQSWLEHRAWLGIGLLCLWFLSLLAPRTPEFVVGLWLGNLIDIGQASDSNSLFGLPDSALLFAEQWAPALANYCFLLAAWLTGFAQTRPDSPRIRLLIILVALTLLCTLIYPLAQTPMTGWPERLSIFWANNFRALALAAISAVPTRACSKSTRSGCPQRATKPATATASGSSPRLGTLGNELIDGCEADAHGVRCANPRGDCLPDRGTTRA